MIKKVKIILLLAFSIIAICNLSSIHAQPVPLRLKGKILMNFGSRVQPIDQAKVVLYDAIRYGNSFKPGIVKHVSYTTQDGSFSIENATNNKTYFLRVFHGRRLLYQHQTNPASHKIQLVHERKIVVKYRNNTQILETIIVTY